MKLRTVFTLVLAACPSFAAWDIVGSVGKGINDDLNISADRVRVTSGSIAGGVNLGIGIMELGSARLEAEVPFFITAADRIEVNRNGVDVDILTWFFTPGARLRIGSGRASAFASLGVGVARQDGISVSRVLSVNGVSNFAIGYAGGADLRLLGPLKIRGEIRSFAVKGPIGWSNRPMALFGVGLQF